MLNLLNIRAVWERKRDRLIDERTKQENNNIHTVFLECSRTNELCFSNDNVQMTISNTYILQRYLFLVDFSILLYCLRRRKLKICFEEGQIKTMIH